MGSSNSTAIDSVDMGQGFKVINSIKEEALKAVENLTYDRESLTKLIIHTRIICANDDECKEKYTSKMRICIKDIMEVLAGEYSFDDEPPQDAYQQIIRGRITTILVLINLQTYANADTVTEEDFNNYKEYIRAFISADSKKM